MLDDARFAAMAALFPPNPGIRALVHIRVTRVSSSCGFAIPLMDYQASEKS